MKLNLNKYTKYFLIILLILIPLYLLSFCAKKRVEKFSNLYEDRENFINLSSLGLDLGLSDSPDVKKYNSMKTSDVKTTMRDSSEFNGTDNKDLLKQIMPVDQLKNDKVLQDNPDVKNKLLNNAINQQVQSQSKSLDGQRGGVKEVSQNLYTDNTKKLMQNYIQNDTFKNSNSNSLNLGTCNFFNDSCPSDYKEMGSIGLQGLPSGMTLSCGNVSSSKPAVFVAELSNGSISNVVIVDNGSGYNPSKNYSLSIIGGGGGSGAELKPIIGDDGLIKTVNIVKGGSGYKETPKIIIDNSSNSSKCTFCCKSS